MKYSIKGEFEKAKSEYQKALKIDPSNELAGYSLEIIEEVINQKINKDAAIFMFKSGYNTGKGQYDLGINQSNKAIVLNPNLAEAYNSRAIAYAKKGQDAQAISDYSKAISLNSKRAFYFKNRGLAYRRQGHYDLAIKDYTKAIELIPRNAEIYNNRAIAHYYNHKYEKSQKDALKAQYLGYQVHPGFLESLRKALK